MEEETGHIREPITSLDLLEYGAFRETILSSRARYLYVYQSYKGLEAILKGTGKILIANRAELRESLSTKLSFIRILEELGIEPLKWMQVSSKAFMGLTAKELFSSFSGPFVVQVADITRGGGRGLFFVRGEDALRRVREVVGKGVLHRTRVTELLIRPFVEGISISALGCATRQGTVIGPLQLQLIDLYGESPLGEGGIFCGHSWDRTHREGICSQVQNVVRRVGDLLFQKGYRGMFGIDFIGDGERAYPLELNPRLTGALPVLTFLQLRDGILPIEFVHILSFFEEAEFDVEALNSIFQRGTEGAHVILFGDETKEEFYPKTLIPGIYKWESDWARYVGSGHLFPKEEHEFAILEGPYGSIRPGDEGWNNFLRILRIVFQNPITNANGALKEWARNVIGWTRGAILGERGWKISFAHNNPALLKQSP